MPSNRKQALDDLFAVLQGLENTSTGPLVFRSRTVAEEFDAPSAIALFDGDAGEPVDIQASPLLYHFAHEAEVEIAVKGADDAARDTAFDDLVAAIAAAVESDAGLTANYAARAGTLISDDDNVEGAEPLKTATLTIILEYSSPSQAG